MKIALIGYGKMGKAIEKIAVERGHQILAKFNSSNPINKKELELCDVAIEFSKPELVVNNIQFSIECNVPIVVGTTAWNEHLDFVSNLVKEKNAALLHASNFSIGVNIFFELNKTLAKLMSNQAYTATMEEIHHVQKLDAPSGTAITLAEGLIENHQKYNHWKHELNHIPKVQNSEIAIASIRTPEVPGTHTITYQSDVDQISTSHIAHSRDGFALGAVIASEWILGKKGIFTMKDVLKF